MAKLFAQCDGNATAARRIWINRYGNGNVPSTKCIAKHGRRLETDIDPEGVTGFENRHLYVDHPRTVITPDMIESVMELIRESYDMVINYVCRSIYLFSFSWQTFNLIQT